MKPASEPIGEAPASPDPTAPSPAPRIARPVRRSRHALNRVLMISLGALAVILIAVGIGVPQLVYLSEAGRYDEFVDEASRLQGEVRGAEADLASAEVLLHFRQAEAAGLSTRLSALAANSAEVLPEEQSASLTAAAGALAGELPKTPVQADPQLVARAERALQEDPAAAPVSWFAVSPLVAGGLAGVAVGAAEQISREETVTRDAVESAKRRIADERERLETVQQKLAKRTDALESLEATVTESLAVVDEVAAAAPATAAALMAELPLAEGEENPLVELNETMVAAAQSAAGGAAAEAFVRLPDSTLVPETEAPAGTEGATPVDLPPAVRSMLVLSRVEGYVATTAAVRDEQTLQREAAEQREAETPAPYQPPAGDGTGTGTEPPTTPDPPSEPPPPTDPQPPVVDPGPEPPLPPVGEADAGGTVL